jgi:hypothetical protein
MATSRWLALRWLAAVAPGLTTAPLAPRLVEDGDGAELAGSIVDVRDDPFPPFFDVGVVIARAIIPSLGTASLLGGPTVACPLMLLLSSGLKLRSQTAAGASLGAGKGMLGADNFRKSGTRIWATFGNTIPSAF